MPVPAGAAAVLIARLVAREAAKRAAALGVKKLAASEMKQVVRKVAAQQGIKKISDKDAILVASKIRKVPGGGPRPFVQSGGKISTRIPDFPKRKKLIKTEGPRLNKEQLETVAGKKRYKAKVELRRSLKSRPPLRERKKSTKITLPKGIPTRSELEAKRMKVAKYKGKLIKLSPGQYRALKKTTNNTDTIETRILSEKEFKPREFTSTINRPDEKYIPVAKDITPGNKYPAGAIRRGRMTQAQRNEDAIQASRQRAIAAMNKRNLTPAQRRAIVAKAKRLAEQSARKK